jgi:hypothetical protein
MKTIDSKYLIREVPRTGNSRSLCAGTADYFAVIGTFAFVEITIPDDWRHQGLDVVFGFSDSDAVGAALVQEQEAHQNMQ